MYKKLGMAALAGAAAYGMGAPRGRGRRARGRQSQDPFPFDLDKALEWAVAAQEEGEKGLGVNYPDLGTWVRRPPPMYAAHGFNAPELRMDALMAGWVESYRPGRDSKRDARRKAGEAFDRFVNDMASNLHRISESRLRKILGSAKSQWQQAASDLIG